MFCKIFHLLIPTSGTNLWIVRAILVAGDKKAQTDLYKKEYIGYWFT